MVNKVLRGVFFALILAIIIYPAWFIYKHPELLATPSPIASSGLVIPAVFETETEAPLLATPSPIASSVEEMCLVVRALPDGGGALNIRYGPGTSYAVITTLKDGQYLIEEGVSGEWFSVRIASSSNMVSGYVHSKYVKECP